MTADPDDTRATAAVVLAAGAGSRFTGGTHKLLAPLDGRAVVVHVLDAVTAAGFEAVYVVEGAVDLGAVCPSGVRRLPNPQWAEGQATSVAVAVAAARADGHRAIVVGLGDQPGIPAEAWAAVASCPADIAVATYAGRRRNPVRLAAPVWAHLPLRGDEGARGVIASGRFEVVEVPCSGDPLDIDEPGDLERWRHRRAPRNPATTGRDT